MNLKRNILLLTLLLLTAPRPALAWHDSSDYSTWRYHGSGRDYTYSQYIDDYYAPEYSSDIEPLVNNPLYFSTPPSPALLTPMEQTEFAVSIPNNHGGYTTVTLKRSGNGFVGPQGEYYSSFPTVSLLKLMYGK